MSHQQLINYKHELTGACAELKLYDRSTNAELMVRTNQTPVNPEVKMLALDGHTSGKPVNNMTSKFSVRPARLRN